MLFTRPRDETKLSARCRRDDLVQVDLTYGSDQVSCLDCGGTFTVHGSRKFVVGVDIAKVRMVRTGDC